MQQAQVNTQVPHSASTVLGSYLYERLREQLFDHGSLEMCWPAVRRWFRDQLTVVTPEQAAGTVDTYVRRVLAGKIPLRPGHCLWKSYIRWCSSLGTANRVQWGQVEVYVAKKRSEHVERASDAQRRQAMLAEFEHRLHAGRRQRELDRMMARLDEEEGLPSGPPRSVKGSRSGGRGSDRAGDDDPVNPNPPGTFSKPLDEVPGKAQTPYGSSPANCLLALAGAPPEPPPKPQRSGPLVAPVLPAGLQRRRRHARRATARAWARQDFKRACDLALAVCCYRFIRSAEWEAVFRSEVRPLQGTRAVPITYRTFYDQAFDELARRHAMAVTRRRPEPEPLPAGADPKAKSLDDTKWNATSLADYFAARLVEPPFFGRYAAPTNRAALRGTFKRTCEVQGIPYVYQKRMVDIFVTMLGLGAIEAKGGEPWRTYIAKAGMLYDRAAEHVNTTGEHRQVVISEDRKQYWDELKAKGLDWREIQHKVNERFG